MPILSHCASRSGSTPLLQGSETQIDVPLLGRVDANDEDSSRARPMVAAIRILMVTGCQLLQNNDPEWRHRPGTVFMDFSCTAEGGGFTFNGFWQIRDCPPVKLKKVRLTLLTWLPHFNGCSLTEQEEKNIARRIGEVAKQRGYQPDEFGSYIDESFLEFWEEDARAELRQKLVDQVAEAARELCRNDQFDPSLTLRAIRACKEDPEWLAGYARFVGGGIYDQANPLKRPINQAFGRHVKSAVGAEDQKDKSGNPVRQHVENEIIQSYTLFEDYDLEALETP